MPSPTMVRGLVGHFPCGADPPVVDHHASPPPVKLPRSMSLWAILAAGDGGIGVRGGAGGCKSPRNGGGGSRGAGGRSRGGRGAKLGMVLAERRTTEATAMMASTECGRGGETEDLPGGKKMTAQGESTVWLVQTQRRAQPTELSGSERRQWSRRQRERPRLQGGGEGG